MKAQVYTVTAYKFGDRTKHSYIVGVYPKKHTALKAAEIEEDYRGNKYTCEVVQWILGEGVEGSG